MHLVVDGIVYGRQKFGGINTWFNQVLPRLAGREDMQVDLLLPDTCLGTVPSSPVRRCRRDLLPTRTGVSWTLDQYIEPILQEWNMQLLGVRARTKRNAIFQSTYLTYLRSSMPQVAFALDMNHELFPEQYNNDSGRWLRRQYPAFLRHAKRIIAISDVTKCHVSRYYHIDPSVIDVVYLATDPQVFFVDRREAHLSFLKSKLSIRPPYILYVGNRGSEYKNFWRLLDAFVQCKERHNLQLVLAGPDWGRPSEIARLTALNCFDSLRLVVGPDDDLLRLLYSHAVAFAYPSLHEGFGIPLLEAMACGTPVLAASTKVFREVAGEAALYFNPYDPGDLAEKISACARKDVRDSCAALGFQQVKKYSWDRCANEMLATYRKALVPAARTAHDGGEG